MRQPVGNPLPHAAVDRVRDLPEQEARIAHLRMGTIAPAGRGVLVGRLDRLDEAIAL
jgi:hypothetical protein